MFLVVPEASLASCWPAHLRMEAEGTERVTGLPVGGAGGGGVDRHRGLIDSQSSAGREVVWTGAGWSEWCLTASLATTGPNIVRTSPAFSARAGDPVRTVNLQEKQLQL